MTCPAYPSVDWTKRSVSPTLCKFPFINSTFDKEEKKKKESTSRIHSRLRKQNTEKAQSCCCLYHHGDCYYGKTKRGNLFPKTRTYLKGRMTQRKETVIFHLLLHPSNVDNPEGWARLKKGEVFPAGLPDGERGPSTWDLLQS